MFQQVSFLSYSKCTFDEIAVNTIFGYKNELNNVYIYFNKNDYMMSDYTFQTIYIEARVKKRVKHVRKW